MTRLDNLRDEVSSSSVILLSFLFSLSVPEPINYLSLSLSFALDPFSPSFSYPPPTTTRSPCAGETRVAILLRLSVKKGLLVAGLSLPGRGGRREEEGNPPSKLRSGQSAIASRDFRDRRTIAALFFLLLAATPHPRLFLPPSNPSILASRFRRGLLRLPPPLP